MQPAARLQRIPPYAFAELNAKRRQALARGVDVISLGVGDPDRPTPGIIIERLAAAARDPRTHPYPDYEGSPAFREAVAAHYLRRYGVEVDPRTEVMALIGSKEGLAHLVWAFVDPGDAALVTDPGYPVPAMHTLLCGGRPVILPLEASRAFLPDLGAVPPADLDRAKLLFLNYPNNPTGAVADLAFFEQAVAFCREHGLLLVHDAAYADITFDGYAAPSPLQVPGAKDVTLEFGSLSKPFNMTGWRIGYAVGSARALEALGTIKTHTDSGQFTAVQDAAIAALGPEGADAVAENVAVYARRRDRAVDVLRRLGFPIAPPKGTFYLWVPVPEGMTSAGFAAGLLDACGVLVTPGSASGRHGEGYVRITLTVPDDRLDEALARLENARSLLPG